MNKLEPKNKNKVLKKHVYAIHCSSTLTLVQRKLFNALLLNAYHDLKQKSQHQITVKELSQVIGFDSKNTKKLKNSLLNLISTVIEWNITEDSDDSWAACTLVAAAKMEKGICTYEFSSTMNELFYYPDMYGKIDLNVMKKFKSSYGLVLYENCARYENLPHTKWLTLSVFRKLMGVKGDKYKVYADLKKRVIEPAVREVNENTGISVIPEIKRIGRNVSSIRFLLSKKQISTIASSHFDTDHNVTILEAELKEHFRLSDEIISSITLNYPIEYIKEKIGLIKNSDSYKDGKIKAISAYFVDSLKKNYQANKPDGAIVENKETEFSFEDNRKQKDRDMEFRNKANRQFVSEYLEELTEKEKENLTCNFEAHMSKAENKFFYKKYKELGLNSPAIKSIFNTYVMEVALSSDISHKSEAVS